ncbi:flavin reductase family protein [Rhizobium paknamense]|uniref:Flavin reductase (DIM6/NTAB) family NADH-FMN oxidoreductase RutF n=1 Tax=Rhizobium paknamense TaxID=1206817 RepID=A0ABU0IDH0_9HYPH|nr:flavin reductase family protein [Rhizobium paknamense]MDQ0455737.1 flavin reductase (DIM6/NTAB) family NADH-FMN oxidoreductase RutF [Rhizobium paknamense]
MTTQFAREVFKAADHKPEFEDRPGDAESLKLALRTLAGGVSIITTGEGEARTGATVTSATALSVDPPRMLVSLNRTSSTWPVLEKSGFFGVNILGPSHEALANQFAGVGGLKGAERYRGFAWSRAVTGAPLLDDAVAAIDCSVEEAIERHSHVIVIGKVHAIRLTGGRSLVYQGGAYHKLG